MGDNLSSLFCSSGRFQFSDDLFSIEANHCLEGKRIDKKTLEALIEECKVSDSSFSVRVSSLEKFLTVVLFTYPFSMSYEESLLPKGAALLQDTIYDDNLLIKAQKMLISHLLGGDLTFELTKDLISEKKPYLDEAKAPFPAINLNYAIICLVLGALKKRDDLTDIGIHFADWYSRTLDYQKEPFLALWSKEKSYDELKILSSYFLLFYSAYHLGHQKRFAGLMHALLEQITKRGASKRSSPPIFLTMLELMIETIKQPIESLKEDAPISTYNFFDPKYALISEKNEKMSFIASFNQVGTGFGSLHAHGAAIKTFGPLIYPLDNPGGFGVYSPSIEGFKTLNISEDKLEGWQRLCQPSEMLPNENGLWLYTSLQKEPHHIHIKTHLREESSSKICFAFYVNANLCKVQDKIIEKRSLHHYSGESGAVSIQGDYGEIKLEPDSKNELHIIPLAGDGCFWDADFLIAYELNKEPLTISVQI